MNGGDAKESKHQQSAAVEPTPATKAFMDRLRGMYDTAQKRGPYDLRQPSSGNEKTDEAKVEATSALPRPVPSRAGDLTVIMENVLGMQRDQPWLVSDEARAPSKSGEHDTFDDHPKSTSDVGVSKKLKAARYRLWASQPSKAMFAQRKKLPAFAMRDEITAAIREHQVVVISGATGKCSFQIDSKTLESHPFSLFLGSGKTTQVPQFVLDDMISRECGAHANILVTQPRRISAIGVAERMAKERCEKCGQTVGYSIKLENKTSRNTRLLLCTTGILLRRLMGDPDLAAVSHVFVDEVHLRDIQTDFCLIILRELLKRRKQLKVILMSATLNAKVFSAYFDSCAIVSIPGRTHPVETFWLEDILQETDHVVFDEFTVKKKDDFSDPKRLSKTALRRLYYPKYKKEVIDSLSVLDEELINYPLLAQLLEHICLNKEEGAILVFMPGIAEIAKAIDEIRKIEFFQSPSVLILPLHASLPSSEQTAVVSRDEKSFLKDYHVTTLLTVPLRKTMTSLTYLIQGFARSLWQQTSQKHRSRLKVSLKSLLAVVWSFSHRDCIVPRRCFRCRHRACKRKPA